MYRLLSLVAMASFFLCSCTSREQKQKDHYYKTYYRPAGTETPKESVSK